MVYRCLEYLYEPNPRLQIHERRSTFTRGDEWAPIDMVQSWNDFASLFEKYRDRLNKVIDPDPLVLLCEETSFNHIYDEAGLAQLHGISIIMPVCRALPDGTFLNPGGSISIYRPDLRPDWGAIRTTEHGPRVIACGDTKIGWDVRAAMKYIQSHPDGYDFTNGRDIVLPLEQLQNYCLGFEIAFGFILTEEYLVYCQFSLSDDMKHSPRPKRANTRYHHSRIQSTSTASTGLESSLSEMSFEPNPIYQNVGPVKISIDRLSPLGESREFSIKLSLWLLIMQARDHPGLRKDDADYRPSTLGEGGQLSSRNDKEKRRERHY